MIFTRASTALSLRLPLRSAAASRRLLSISPNISKVTRSPKIVASSAAAAVFAACVAGAAAVALCEEDRLERWNNRWATGNVVRLLDFLVGFDVWLRRRSYLPSRNSSFSCFSATTRTFN